MRDAVNLVKAGHPAVLFVNGPFERAARAQAKGLGEPDLNIYVFPQYEPGKLSSTLEEEKAVKASAEFPALLLTSRA